MYSLQELQDGRTNLYIEHYWSQERQKVNHTLAIKLLPGNAIAAHISLAKASRVAKLDISGTSKYNLSPKEGQKIVKNNNTVYPKR